MSGLPPGFELDQPSAAPALPPGFVVDQPSVMADVAKQGGIGLAKAGIGLAGLPGDISGAIDSVSDWTAKKLGMDPAEVARQRAAFDKFDFLPTSQGIQNKIEGVTGKFPEPQTTAGKYAQTIGEFAPAAFGGEGTLLARGLRAAIPGAASEAAGQATEGTAAEPWARAGGAIAGAIAPAVARRAITPFPIAPERQASVDALRNAGVNDLTAGQVTGSKGLQYLESEGFGNTAENQKEQFTRAALHQVGENAPRATPEVIDRAFTRIGGEFDRLSAQNSMHVTVPVWNDLQTAARDYHVITPPSMRAPIVQNVVNDIGNAAVNNNGVLTGDVYQHLRSQIGRAARSARANPELAGALNDIQTALDDGMERSLIAAGNPQAVQDWQQARNQYRNMLVVEKAATGAGADTAEGLISPAQLRNATVTQNRRAYARGQGDFADLARAGTNIMSPLPQSGTAPRLAARALGSGLGALAGSGEGPEGAGVGATLGAVGGPWALARMATMGRGYLGNQVMADAIRNAPPAMRQALLNSVLGANSSRLQPPAAVPPIFPNQLQPAGR